MLSEPTLLEQMLGFLSELQFAGVPVIDYTRGPHKFSKPVYR